MAPKNRLCFISALSLLVLSFTQTVSATNGYFTHGLGVKNKALAGAGTAMPTEAMATANNPAAAVMVGNRFEAGLSIFSPRRSYKSGTSLVNGNFGAFTIGPNNIDSDSNYFPIPYIAKVWPRGDNAAFSLNFHGRGGMNTDWGGGTASLDPDGPGPAPVMTLPGTFGAGRAGVNLSQAFLHATYAIKSGSWNLGISAIAAVQLFEAKGLATFAGFTESFAASGGTALPTNLTNNGNDTSTGLGFKIGAIYNATDRLNLGFAYQGKISMSEFDDYSDLFAQSGGFDIPASGRLSASYQSYPGVSIHFDYERTWFSDVDSVGNSIQNIFACPTAGAGGTSLPSCLGGNKGAGFGWDDVEVYKFGIEWAYSSTTMLRAGYSTARQPINKDQVLFNILAPAVIEQHITFGFTRQLGNDREFSVAFMYAPSNSVSGTNPFDPTQKLEVEMRQYEIEFGYQF
jgi:long-chain fatty acid transport protein